MTEDRLLTVPEVAERMRVGVDTVRRWLRTGRLKGLLPGGTKTGYRVRESDLRAFMDSAATGER
jgi:excisionase family DNA binding protein